MSDNRIEVNLDDEQPQGAPAQNNRIVITNADLASVPETPVAPPSAHGQYQAPYGGYYQAKPTGAGITSGGMIRSLIAGIIGGLLAWAVNEPFCDDGATRASVAAIVLEMGIFGGLIGGIIGCCLGAAEGVANQVYEKALRAGAIGLAIGAAGGFVGGMFGQLVYGSLLASGGPSMGTVMVARVLGWGVVGVFVGLGQGVGRGSGKRAINGLIGGVVGGVVAGLVFDPISIAVSTGLLSRAVGITILGGASGLAIGLVEEIRKQAWLSIIQGPLAGKQFILYELRTRIGSSPKCEITLLKDPAVMPEHAVIEAQGASYVLSGAQPQASVVVNGQPVRNARLRSGDVITLGSTSMLFEEKAVSQQGYQQGY